MIRGFPNGETLHVEGMDTGTEYIGVEERTWGSETSQYPEEEKSNEIP